MFDIDYIEIVCFECGHGESGCSCRICSGCSIFLPCHGGDCDSAACLDCWDARESYESGLVGV